MNYRDLRVSIVHALFDLHNRSVFAASGFEIAMALKDKSLVPRGTLYRALHSLESDGILASRWDRVISKGDLPWPKPDRRRVYWIANKPKALKLAGDLRRVTV